MNKEMFLIPDLTQAEKKPMRDGYGEALLELAEKNENIVALTADLKESLRVDEFANKFPKRFFEMGIAEQNMMGVAAGMAVSGKIPLVNSLGVFSPGRNWDQLRVSVCLSKANVKVIAGHAGFGNGGDGANQQTWEDVGSVRVLPNIMIVAPCDYEQIKKALKAICEYKGPVMMRMTKPSREVITTKMTPFVLGKAQVFKEGKDVTVLAYGQMVFEALKAAEELKKEVSVEVVNVHTIKPIDRETILKSVKKTRLVITAEEHQVNGSLGSAVAEVIAEEGKELALGKPVIMRRIGMMDRFGESGEVSDLMDKYGLTAKRIVEAVRELTNS
jgi:transketolase